MFLIPSNDVKVSSPPPYINSFAISRSFQGPSFLLNEFTRASKWITPDTLFANGSFQFRRKSLENRRKAGITSDG